MTDSDLQTCRTWCRANGVSVELVDGDKGDVMYHLRGRQRWMGDEFDYWCQTEQEVYAALWQRLGPWLQSVRNLDAVEVPGPYEACEPISGLWLVHSNGLSIASKLQKETARTIANTLNRECGDGK